MIESLLVAAKKELDGYKAKHDALKAQLLEENKELELCKMKVRCMSHS